MLCRNCKEKMKNIPQAFDAFSFAQASPQYCENNECEEFGYVTMVGIKEEKKESNINKLTE